MWKASSAKQVNYSIIVQILFSATARGWIVRIRCFFPPAVRWIEAPGLAVPFQLRFGRRKRAIMCRGVDHTCRVTEIPFERAQVKIPLTLARSHGTGFTFLHTHFVLFCINIQRGIFFPVFFARIVLVSIKVWIFRHSQGKCNGIDLPEM